MENVCHEMDLIDNVIAAQNQLIDKIRLVTFDSLMDDQQDKFARIRSLMLFYKDIESYIDGKIGIFPLEEK